MKIVRIDGFTAHCEAKGVTRDINTFLIQDQELKPGEYVLVHVGYAIQKISEAHARSAWELYDEMLAAEAGYDHA